MHRMWTTWRAGFLALAAMVPQAQAQRAAPAPKATTQQGYNLAFADADVRRVIDAVLGSMLNVDYSIDPAVQGTISLRTSKPVPRAELIPLLEKALVSVDAVIIERSGAYQVLKRDQARSRAPLAGGQAEGASSSPSGYATEVVPLRRTSAKQVARLLEQFLGKEIVSGGGDDGLNQIMITGSAEERAAARKLIERFDVDTLANMQFELFRLENVDPQTLQTELERIFQPPYDILGSRIRIVPLPRLRSLLVIAATREDISRVAPWVQRLDSGVAGKRRLYNYAVQNGRARDLAAALQQVLSSGDNQGNAMMAAMAPAPATPAQPSDTIAPQAPLPAAGASGTAQSGGGPRIVPNEPNNSLIIYADGEEYELIQQALRQLDQPVPQVLLEATLAEVTLSDDFRFGVNFSTIQGDTRIAQSNSASATPASVFPGFSTSYIGGSASAVLNTLQSKTNVRVLSAPKLIVLNNQTATLQVGDQVPIVVQQQQSVSSPGAPVLNTVELRDTGVILKVTPRVNDSGTITIDVAQEVSDVATTTTSGINSPTIQQRRFTSTVATRSGQMIALGGLIRDRRTKTKSGIPLLSQIPIIGGLFGAHSNEGTRTELIILLTPTVIRSPDQVGSVVDALIEGLDTTRPLVDSARERQVGGHAPRQ